MRLKSNNLIKDISLVFKEMVESSQQNYDVSFEMKKHFTPSEITGNLLINIISNVKR